MSFLGIENNPETGCYFVGRGGFPNANGVLECDAAVMVGKDCSFGAVASLQGYIVYWIALHCGGRGGGGGNWEGTKLIGESVTRGALQYKGA